MKSHRVPATHVVGCGQRGQALVLGMLFMGLLALALTRYFGVGQVAAARARHSHAVDAAAYSGAIVQARAFNMLAYVNRSHVAHQVALAHLVTLGSWAKFGDTQSSQLMRGNPPGYLIGMLFGPDHGLAYRAARQAAGLHRLAGDEGELAAAYEAHERVVHDILAGLQHDIVTGLAHARSQAIQEILQHNFPEYASGRFRVAFEHDTLPGYVAALQGNAGSAQGMRRFVMTAVGFYRFLHRRDFTAINHWQVNKACPHLRHQLRRRGRTLLDKHGVWQSSDTQSFHALRFNRWVLCYYREYPMAWAWIGTGNARFMSGTGIRPAQGRSSMDDVLRMARQGPWASLFQYAGNRRANRRAVIQRNRWDSRGLPTYYDVDKTRAAQTVRFGLQLTHPGPSTRTILTRSAAETFFDRPSVRKDGRAERPHLFNPYWQARLAPIRSARP